MEPLPTVLATKAGSKTPVKTKLSLTNGDDIENLPEVVKKSIKTREQDLSVLTFTNKVKYTDFYNLADFKVNLKNFFV